MGGGLEKERENIPNMGERQAFARTEEEKTPADTLAKMKERKETKTHK
jgi:hypothetical protein